MVLKSKRETRRQNRPMMEALEGRLVLSTFQATNVTQLQADIAAVNNTAGPNTILLKPGVYLMTSELQIQNAGNLTIRPSSTRLNNQPGRFRRGQGPGNRRRQRDPLRLVD